ncbi:GTP-binding protein [Tistrella sp. BH-R2-4]|uniref:GTP-binding protein n=1 Tax=Tistrella arctica TaxID=3133430 RepID=A0ABU9YLX7_9PROT
MLDISSSRIPLTIIGGFLGSGKTTLLNRIISSADGRRFAVIVNDFGDINIDARLVVSVEGETIALSNGCICCVIRDDLVTEVQKLCRLPDPPEHIIIESSGVSRPLSIVDSFFRPEIRQLVDVQTIITLLDADLVVDEAATYADIAYAQIAVADLVVVNKIDLVSSAQRAAVRAQVERIVPRARIVETTFGRIPLALLFDHDVSAAIPRLPREMDPTHLHVHSANDDHGHDHSGDFSSWGYRSTEKSFSFNAIQRIVEKLPRGIYRAKGLIRLTLGNGEHGIFQLAGRRSSLKLTPSTPGVAVTTEIVFIGQPGTITDNDLRDLIDDAWRTANDPLSGPHIVTDLRAFQVEFV